MSSAHQISLPVPPAAEQIEAHLRELFGDAVAVPNAQAFAALHIEKSLGYQLIDLGYLHRTKIGRASRVFVYSIRDVLVHGVPPMPKAKPPKIPPRAVRQLITRPQPLHKK